MNASWDRLRYIFDRAATLDAADRDALLDRELAGDPELRGHIEGLLAAHDAAASVLASRGALVSADEDPLRTVDRTSPGTGGTLLGSEIGPYRLLEKIGEGGFGVVFLAEQRVPFQRKVALKLLRADANSSQVLARFDAERQALALMDHAHIASAYDAGATPQGQPYFVMEYVAGLPITRFADERKLSIEERLQLFLQLCDAIQHAHQKGVIHRDLKPSNVLVSTVDQKPQVKVIDFGVAKALGARLTDQTLHTQLGVVIGTPEYMSPEQAEGSAIAVDTRSDVYSLGVILYELLAGALPIDRKGLGEGALAEMFRRIRQDEPPRLSTKLQSLGEEAQKVAERRRSDAASLARQLRGDLEWITLKALEKEPVRRYPSVGALGEDIVRSLANRPISAHPPSAAYQLRKFAVRRKGVVAFVGTVFVLAVGSAIAMTALYARQRTEALKAERVSAFLQEMLAASDPERARGKEVLARDVMDQAADRVKTELANEPLVQAEVFRTLSQAYGGLGLFEEAMAQARAGVDAAIRARGPNSLEAGRAKGALAAALFDASLPDSGIAASQQALKLLRRNRSASFDEIVNCERTLANCLEAAGKPGEAEEMYRRIVAELRAAPERDRISLPSTLNDFAQVLEGLGKLGEAEDVQREALGYQMARHGIDHPDVLTDHTNLGIILRKRRKFAEAESIYRQIIPIERRVLGNLHPRLASGLSNYGILLKTIGRYSEAESAYVESIRIYRTALREDSPELTTGLNNLASLYSAQGRYEDAQRLYEEALASRIKIYGDKHPAVATVQFNLAGTLFSRGEFPEAEPLAKVSLASRLETVDETTLDVVRIRQTLAQILIGQDKLEEATQVLEANLAAQERAVDRDDVLIAWSRSLLGQCRLRQEDLVAAEPLLVGSVDAIWGDAGIGKGRKRTALRNTIEVLAKVGKHEGAAVQKARLDSLEAQ